MDITKKEQSQSAGEHSTQTQVVGENSTQAVIGSVRVVNHYHQGLDYASVKQICHEVIRAELEKYTQSALSESNRRWSDTVDKLMGRLRTSSNGVLEKFKEPAVQYSIHNVLMSTIKDPTPETQEELLDLLMDRLGEDEHSSRRVILDEAIMVLPKLSRAAVAFLAMNLFMQYRFYWTRTDLETSLAHLSPILDDLQTFTGVDYALLKQLGCGYSVRGVTNHKSLTKHLLDSNGLFFCNPIPICYLDETLDRLKDFIPNATKKDEAYIRSLYEDAQGGVLFEFTNMFSYRYFVAQEEIDYVSPAILEINKHFEPYQEKDVKEKLVSLDSRWDRVLFVMDHLEVSGFVFFPVGAYIGACLLKKNLATRFDVDALFSLRKI